MADHITPDLIETAARALVDVAHDFGHGQDVVVATDRAARAVLEAVAPLIDRAAELREQAKELRIRARWNEHGGKNFAGAKTRHTVINKVAEVLESRAAGLLSAPTEEN